MNLPHSTWNGDVEINQTQTRLNPEGFATKGYTRW
jgi:hypothetical protein